MVVSSVVVAALPRREQVGHERPNIMAFFTFRFPPRRLEGLGGDLHANGLARQDVQIPLRVGIGAPLRCDDHDLAADIAVDQRADVSLPRLAPHVLDQTMRGELTAADGADVHDVAAGAARAQVELAMVADPVPSLRSDRCSVGVAHG